MHRMIKSCGVRKAVLQEAPFGLASLVIAELFYKFHSFVIECLAFLITWYILSWIGSRVFKANSSDEQKVSCPVP